MYKVLVYLIAIAHTSKDIHYRTGGDKFWGDHLLADRIHDDLDGFIDDINENFYLGKEEDAPQQTKLLEDAAELVPEVTDDMKLAFASLDRLIIGCINAIETLSALNDLTAGDNDLIGRICSDLQKKHGFLWRRLK